MQLLQVFESHAGYLGSALFNEYSLQYLRNICKNVKEKLIEAKMEPVPMVFQIVLAEGAIFMLTPILCHLLDCVR